MTDLAAQLARARADYYAGKPTLSDEAYDALEAALKKSDPDNPLLKTVGAPASNTLKKVAHATFMGSLSNAFDEADIASWLARIIKARGKLPKTFTVTPKMDGLSIQASYRKGVLVHALTRGDGKEGEDVTANVLRGRGLPRTLPVPVDVDVRGECMILKKRFESVFKPLGDSNPRNSAAGTVRRSDGIRSEHLRFYAFDANTVVDGALSGLSHHEWLGKLDDWGFNVVQYDIVTVNDLAAAQADLTAAWRAFGEKRANLPYDVDGCVLRASNRAAFDSCGWTDTCPKGAIAAKWRGGMVAQTKVRALHNSVGHTGTITPVLIVDPVACGGVTVSKASLMNWDEIGRIGGVLGIDAVVQIERAGDVIPRATAVLVDAPVAFKRPEECPSCGAESYEDGPRQVCRNVNCPAQTFRKVLNWVRGLNIMYLGETTLDKLMALNGPVGTIADLYRLSRPALAAASGDAMAEKILKEIEKSKTITVPKIIGNLGIPGIGETEAEKVWGDLKTVPTVDDLLMVDLSGLGPVKGRKLQEGLKTYTDLLRDLWNLLSVEVVTKKAFTGKGTSLTGKTVALTGASELPRNTLIQIITDAGGIYKTSVVNGLDYLAMADPSSGSTKARAAAAKGVACISEAQLLKMAGHS
jgi:DNA ligase (NAD+)